MIEPVPDFGALYTEIVNPLIINNVLEGNYFLEKIRNDNKTS